MGAGEARRRRRARRVNGEGTVFQRKDGRWVGQAYVLQTDGTRRRKTIYGATRVEVTTRLADLVARSDRGVAVPARSCTVGEYLDYWLGEIVSQRRATTQRGYESAVRRHIRPVLGSRRLDRLTPADVRGLLAVMREKCLCCANRLDVHRPAGRRCCSAGRCCGRTPSVRQVQFVHAVLRNALSNALREELVLRNVASLVQVPTPRYDIGQGLAVNDVRRLLMAASSDRLFALYLVAATMGLRRGELLGLRWCDVDLDAGTLRVRQTVQRVRGELIVGVTKTRGSERVVPLPEPTRQALIAHRARQASERLAAGSLWADHDLVFPTSVGTPMEPRSLNRHFDRVRRRAGLATVRLHDLRHTVVTLLLELKVPPHIVQAIAGHADPDVTMRVYAHANLEAMRTALDKLGERLA